MYTLSEMTIAAKLNGMNYGKFVWELSQGLVKMPSAAEIKAVMPEKKRKHQPEVRAVVQYDPDGNRIAEYPNAVAAARMLGKEGRANITAACEGKYKSAYGFLWRYAGDAAPAETLTRICKICGSRFRPKHPSAKYCGSECANQAKRRSVHEFYERNQRKTARHKANCLYCGMVFVADGRKTTFCSTKCKIMYHNRRGDRQ